ncbi:MAG: DUF5616 domain-containing protein [Candidatus Korarchaeota archaeon]|nr:DUF5616 domain-containing protein [Candidatus Korarchaeota archaeon]
MESLVPLTYTLFTLGFRDSVEIVGRRFSLRKMEVVALSKLVRSPEESLRNSLKVVPAKCVSGRDLGIDGFNVLITLEAALSGQPVYVCSDGLVRDLSLVYSSYKPSGRFDEAVHLLDEVIKQLEPSRAVIYLDSPISKSGRIASRIRNAVDGAEVVVSKRVDSDILEHEVVASSDSRIISHAACIVDLPRIALERIGILPKSLFPSEGRTPGLRFDRPTQNG